MKSHLRATMLMSSPESNHVDDVGVVDLLLLRDSLHLGQQRTVAVLLQLSHLRVIRSGGHFGTGRGGAFVGSLRAYLDLLIILHFRFI